MIAFIEGRMTMPMGTITRNYIKFFRLSPTQCGPNMFRVLGSIEALSERMNLNLTHHDVKLGVQSAQSEGARILPQVDASRSKANLVPPHFKQNFEGGFSYIFWGMTRWPTLSNGGGRTRWGYSCRSMNFCLNFFRVSIFLFLMKPHSNSMILQTSVLPNPSLA